MSLRDLVIHRPKLLAGRDMLLRKVDKLIENHRSPKRIRADYSFDAGFDAGYVAALKRVKTIMAGFEP